MEKKNGEEEIKEQRGEGKITRKQEERGNSSIEKKVGTV